VPSDYLTPILQRKQREVQRRRRHAAHASTQLLAAAGPADRASLAIDSLRRPPGAAPRVIAEIKRRSPSAGQLRVRLQGDVARLADAYARGGAAAVSVLCDRVGFDGTALDVRRVARTVRLPILFKEFVLDELQIELAQRVGAHMVLLLVRALPGARLQALVESARSHGLAAVVEAADEQELDVALATSARIVGVNARDLRTFQVDERTALRALERVPADRVAVHMSGVRTGADFERVAAGRADAVLIGESLMRASDPAAQLRALRGVD
jgi:indole-3-glycerol phosphate synthase